MIGSARVALIVVGLLLGPVLRAQIVRYAVPDGTDWRERCGFCAHPFGLALSPSGRCAGCRQRTGPPAGVVEFVVAVALAILVFRVHVPLLPLLALCWLVVVGIVLAFVDLAVSRLPNRLTAAAAAGVALLLGLAAVDEGHLARLGWALVCGLAAAACYLPLVFLAPAGMGMGDVKLAIGIGIALGWAGGTTTFLGVAAGFLVNGVVGVVLLTTGRASRGDQLPHGPAMLVGGLGILAVIGG
jgi:leader peptidase (prepilin peptidase)/N-methyltransferase